MQNFLYAGRGPMTGELRVYPAGFCFFIEDLRDSSKIILKLDDAGFGQFAKFLDSQTGDKPMPEVVIHGFRVTYVEGSLHINGSVIANDGKKTAGAMSLYLGGDMEILADVVTQVNGEGYLLWYLIGTTHRLELTLSHKSGLRFSVWQDEKKIESHRMLYYPEEILTAISEMAAGAESRHALLTTPWGESLLSFHRDKMVVTGYLAHEIEGGAAMLDAEIRDLLDLNTVLYRYFRAK